MESFEEACAIHQTLEETYKSFDYTVRTIPFGTIENRVDHLLDILGADHE